MVVVVCNITGVIIYSVLNAGNGFQFPPKLVYFYKSLVLLTLILCDKIIFSVHSSENCSVGFYMYPILIWSFQIGVNMMFLFVKYLNF